MTTTHGFTHEAYHTGRIINRVAENYNHDMVLQFSPINGHFNDEDTEPDRIDQSMVTRLDFLFLAGAEIVLETDIGYDDDGGNCYQAYIIKPEHKAEYDKHYFHSLEDENMANSSLVAFTYILAHPDHFISVWAGPY